MPSSTEQQRLVSMLDYLDQWDKLNRSATFDVGTHQGGFLVWQADVEGLPGVYLDVADASGETWLEIERLRAVKPPAPPPELIPWLIIRDDPFVEPSCRETLPNPQSPLEPLKFEEDPSLVSVLERYRTGLWRAWSDSEMPRRKSIAIYDKLFNLLQTIETEGAETALELVWGIGVAVWHKDGKRIRYPILSRLVEIDPITTDMALRIRPREVQPILETDIYVALEINGLPAFEKAARAILENPDCNVRPFDESSFEQILAGAAGTLDRQARYWPREIDFEAGKLPPSTEALTITNSWVLFARRKGTNFLVEDIRRLRNAVESGPIPDGAPRVLVETPEGAVPMRDARFWRGLSSTGFSADDLHGHNDDSKSISEPDELFFPKPFNAEQVQIIDKLEHASGVVVQGPPGTGKTHTIANIICHYLANGKRVLVTSKGESALTVLRQQLPTPVQSLTVSLLTSEREGLKQLEQSVSKITTEITNLNKAEMRREIESCRKTIDQLHKRIGTIDCELADWAKRNIDPVPASLDGLKPAALAQHVVASEEMHSWFPDRLDGRPEHEPSFTPEHIARLRADRELVGDDLKYLETILPSIDDLPNILQVADLHSALLDLDDVNGKIDEHKIPRFRSINAAHLADATHTRDLLRDAARIRRSLSDTWVDWLRQQYEFRDASAPMFSVISQIAGELSALVDIRRQFYGVAIDWDEEWDADDTLFDAVLKSASGKTPFGLNPFGKKVARDRLQRIRLNGQKPKTSNEWKWIESHFSMRRQTRILVIRWNSLSNECPAPPLPHEPSQALRASEVLLAQMAEAQRWVNELAPSLSSQVEAIFADLSADGIASDPSRMEALAGAIEIRLKRHRLESARTEQIRMREIFKIGAQPLFRNAQTFIDNVLGNSSHDTLSVEKEWQSVLSEIARLWSLSPAFARIRQVCSDIEASGASRWAALLRTMPHIDGERDWTPPNWASAWKWSRQFGYLLSIDGRERLQQLTKQRHDLQNDLAAAYAMLVQQLTWLKLRETLDEDRGLMAALQQYMAAIRGIGGGTGVRAVRYRQDARRAMARANRAIRCWIMPHWRVSESLPSELALFDLVIVDEASQSDLWALPSLLRAKKLLIVGDNKQVSPSAVGVREVDIRLLHARFLRDLPFGDVLTPEKSIYDLACVMFASDLVRLREHFRCVEPIIEFSNRLCYNGEIRCLRVPTSSERITPPLVDVFVRDGARDARTVKVNRTEARAIVDEIKKITANPAFAQRTIGVVSLLGNEQPRYIFELLISELGEEKIVRHQIRCGDAMTFQGREADIVFISMVSDTQTVRALSGEMFEQRFNVAASRAKDRLYLYRSFRREDLRESDLRARLLEHFAAPLHRDPEKKGRERCESDFERAVFDRLHAAGYKITPQVPSGGYRIDMVVEGRSGRRLAIECDGDQYHTPDTWLQDLHRQRVLERAGWTFWRCWGSSFIRDPESCMSDLFRTLEGMNIQPLGAQDLDLSEIVEYREVGELFGDSDTSVPSEETKPIEAQETLLPKQGYSTLHVQTESPRDMKSELSHNIDALPLFKNNNPTRRVQINDSVRYCFIDNSDEAFFVTIVESESKPHLGLINSNTPIAMALLGLAVGEQSDALLPVGRITLRLLELHRPTRR